jgi:hypothetical protein
MSIIVVLFSIGTTLRVDERTAVLAQEILTFSESMEPLNKTSWLHIVPSPLILTDLNIIGE